MSGIIEELAGYCQSTLTENYSNYAQDQFKIKMQRLADFWEIIYSLPNWKKLANYFILCQPSSSAAAEVLNVLFRS